MSPNRSIAGPAVVPFVVLNHCLEPDALRSWIVEIAEGGVDGICLHPRLGLMTPYLSESWFAAIDACLDAAREMGITVWLYDEFPYPSGAAGGRVLSEHPELIEQHLEVFRIPFSDGLMELGRVDEGAVVEAFLVRRSPAGDVLESRRVTDCVGPVIDDWIRTPWDSRYYYDPAATELFSCPRSSAVRSRYILDGRFGPAWTEVVVFRRKTGADFQEPFGHYVDVSSPQTARAFLASTHECYRRRFGRDFGSLISGIFTDEPKYRNGLPWSRSIEKEWKGFREDPSILLALAEEVPGAEVHRKSYRDTCGRLFSENWIGSISRWCADNEISLCGHISPEEDWFGESVHCGSILRVLRKFPIPGCDLIVPAAGDRQNPLLNLTPALACSAAAQAGRRQALCEVFGASDYTLNAQDMKRIADWLMIFGINVFTPHGLFYSIDGERKYDAPPTFCHPNPLWSIFRFWTEHVRRTAAELGPEGVLVSTVLIRPMRFLQGLPYQKTEVVRRLQESAVAVCQRLLSRGIVSHFLDDGDLEEAEVHNGTVVFGAARYTHVIFLRENAETLPMGERLRDAGVCVLAAHQTDEVPGCLASDSGALYGTETRSGRAFVVNVSPVLQRGSHRGTSFVLAGYESRWMGAEEQNKEPSQTIGLDSWDVTRPGDNVVVLKKWHVDGSPGRPGPLYRSHPELAGETVGSALGPVPVEPRLAFPVAVRYETRFKVEDPLKARVILEPGSIGGDWEIVLDGGPIAGWERQATYDRWTLLAPLRELEPGWHVLEVRLLADQSTHGLTDFVRLTGDFSVGRFEAEYPVLATPPESVDAHDWSRSGICHFSGTLSYRTAFENPSTTWNFATLIVDRPLPGHAGVWINGQEAGSLAWAPWRLDVSKFLQSGSNEVVLKVANSLANLIYGRPEPSGLRGARFSIQMG